jgi:DNA-binding MarR family transcriptional regulator
MNMELASWALGQREITSNEKLTLICLCSQFKDESGDCIISKSRLSKITGLSEASVRKSLKSLIDKGLILSFDRFAPDGSNLPNAYVFNLPQVRG